MGAAAGVEVVLGRDARGGGAEDAGGGMLRAGGVGVEAVAAGSEGPEEEGTRLNVDAGEDTLTGYRQSTLGLIRCFFLPARVVLMETGYTPCLGTLPNPDSA